MRKKTEFPPQGERLPGVNREFDGVSYELRARLVLSHGREWTNDVIISSVDQLDTVIWKQIDDVDGVHRLSDATDKRELLKGEAWIPLFVHRDQLGRDPDLVEWFWYAPDPPIEVNDYYDPDYEDE